MKNQTENKTRTAVRITCDTGLSWVTEINATPCEARKYFAPGSLWITEDCETGRETRHRVATVEEVI